MFTTPSGASLTVLSNKNAEPNTGSPVTILTAFAQIRKQSQSLFSVSRLCLEGPWPRVAQQARTTLNLNGAGEG